MKKKLSAILFLLVLCLCTVTPVFAEASDGFAGTYPRVIDNANLLTDSEAEALTAKLDEISVRQNMDITVVTTEDYDGYSLQSYADTLYEECGFGYGDNKDGLMLLISMADSDWYITTCGYGIKAFTDAGIQYIGEQIVPDLSDGKYDDAFSKYAELCDDFITQARNGTPYDSGNLPKKPLSLIWIPVALVIGFVLALIIVGQMKAQLKTVRGRAMAGDYVRQGSLKVNESRDLFLYHTVTRTPRPKKKSSSGSSIHTSSSGTSHGGGGGKF